MERLPICLVGCGQMGNRHVRGYAALERAGHSQITLAGVYDLRPAQAERVAAEAEQLLGTRPRVFASLEEVLADSGVLALDVVTDVRSHPAVAVPALEAGRGVLCEKPLGLTVAACQAIVSAAERGGAVLATAENWRRDPANRLAKAVIDSGVLGRVHLAVQLMIGGGDRIIISPWRHLREYGAIGLDMGVHYTDLMQYYFGPVADAYGEGFIAEPVRRRPDRPKFDTAFSRQQHAAMPSEIQATGEDSVVASYRMESGVRVQLAYVPSGPGEPYHLRTVHGSLGSLSIPRDRTGGSPVLRDGGGEYAGRDLVERIGGFDLDPVTRALFGWPGVPYDLEFAEADAAHVAIELRDFATAVLEGRRPEVDGEAGTAAVAALLAAYESGLLGRPVALAEVLDGTVRSYQEPIDASLGSSQALPR